jgi:hypothetical protein
MNNNSSINNNNSKNASKMRDVLFQKIGATWYIFTENNGEMVYSVMPEGMDPRTTKLELYQIIEEHMERVIENKKTRRQPEAV